jgi:hypothetical protein
MKPSKVVTVIACENRVSAETEEVCGHWAVVTTGDELPHCHGCKRPDRAWRIVTQPEIDDRDARLLRSIERLGVKEPR